MSTRINKFDNSLASEPIKVYTEKQFEVLWQGGPNMHYLISICQKLITKCIYEVDWSNFLWNIHETIPSLFFFFSFGNKDNGTGSLDNFTLFLNELTKSDTYSILLLCFYPLKFTIIHTRIIYFIYMFKASINANIFQLLSDRLSS